MQLQLDWIKNVAVSNNANPRIELIQSQMCQVLKDDIIEPSSHLWLDQHITSKDKNCKKCICVG